MVVVARATGQSIRAIALESWALTMWTHLQVSEMDEIAGVYREGERLDLASVVGVAFHNPPGLKDAEQKWRERAKLSFTADRDASLARSMQMVARLSREIQ